MYHMWGSVSYVGCPVNKFIASGEILFRNCQQWCTDFLRARNFSYKCCDNAACSTTVLPNNISRVNFMWIIPDFQHSTYACLASCINKLTFNLFINNTLSTMASASIISTAAQVMLGFSNLRYASVLTKMCLTSSNQPLHKT